MKKIIIPIAKLIRVIVDCVIFIPALFIVLVVIKTLWDFEFKRHYKAFSDMDYIEADYDFSEGKFKWYYKTPLDYLRGKRYMKEIKP